MLLQFWNWMNIYSEITRYLKLHLKKQEGFPPKNRNLITSSKMLLVLNIKTKLMNELVKLYAQLWIWKNNVI